VDFKPTIVFVYLGGELPRYAAMNLSQTRDKFPNYEVVLISDIQLNSELIPGISFFLVPKLESIWGSVRQNLNHDLSFRREFWFSTLARFSALKIYMEELSRSDILHFELDIWIAPNFPFAIFSEIEEDLAFTLASPSEGSAALLFIRDQHAISKLVSLCEEIVDRSPNSTDMTILREISDRDLMSHMVLPSLPPVDELAHAVFSDYIFDPSSWGMYLLGQDPRNHRGRLILYRNQSEHYVNAGLYNFVFENGVLFVVFNKTRYRLSMLHVHSKDTRIFQNLKESEKFLSERIRRISGFESSEFQIKMFSHLAAKKLVKIFREFTQKLNNLN
jgi:hypothetical protein